METLNDLKVLNLNEFSAWQNSLKNNKNEKNSYTFLTHTVLHIQFYDRVHNFIIIGLKIKY